MDTFIPDITVIDAWKTLQDTYRLVDLGAGPAQLQILENGEYKNEHDCYIHGALCHRIKSQRDAMEEIKELLKPVTKLTYLNIFDK